MNMFPGYTLEGICKLTLIQYEALHYAASEIMEAKAKAQQA